MATYSRFQQPAKYSNVVSFCGIPASIFNISGSALYISTYLDIVTYEEDIVFGSSDNLAIRSLSARAVDILVLSPNDQIYP
jgi:hypothetical protein